MAQYTYNELSVLWYLKRHNGVVTGGTQGGDTILGTMSHDLNMNKHTVSNVLRRLEGRCIILRTYARTQKGYGADGYNPLKKVELVDPDMFLPPLPQLSLGIVIAHENEELSERTAAEPSTEGMVLALVERIVELQAQVDKLQQIVVDQEALVSQLKKQQTRKPHSEGLTQAVRSVLTADQWEKLRHPNG